MKRLLLLALVIAGALGSCSSTLRITATAPTSDNDGPCGAPVLLAAAPLAPRMLHFRWSGPVMGEDSLAATAGNGVTLTRTVPPAWASVTTPPPRSGRPSNARLGWTPKNSLPWKLSERK